MKTKTHIGDLVALPGVVYDIEEITGNLDCTQADENTQFPALAAIGGSADFQGWTGSAPALTAIGGWADFQGWTGSAPALTAIGSSAYFRDWTGSAPALTAIGSSAYFQGWTGNAPALTAIGGSADFQGWTGNAPALTAIGGWAYFRDWTGSAPALTAIGGSADFQGWTGSRENITTNNRNAAVESFNSQGFILCDGIFARLVKKRGNVSRVIIVGHTKQSFVVESNGHFAHGDTLAEARADLLVKIGGRDSTPYKGWTPETTASLEEMVACYRIITGACGLGVRHFLAGRNLPKKLTVGRVIQETVGQYGHDQFKAFFA